MKLPQYKIPAVKNFSMKEFTLLNPSIRTRIQSSCLNQAIRSKAIVRTARGFYARMDNTYPDIEPKIFSRKLYHHRYSRLILPSAKSFKPLEISRLNPNMSSGLIYTHIVKAINEGRLVRVHRNKYRHNLASPDPVAKVAKVVPPSAPEVCNLISDEVLMKLIRTGVLKIVAA